MLDSLRLVMVMEIREDGAFSFRIGRGMAEADELVLSGVYSLYGLSVCHS